MQPDTADVIADLAYGGLLFAAVVILALYQSIVPAVTFSLGVLLAYAVHVWWKMARYDPEWMTRAEVEDHIEAEVEDQIDDAQGT